jgi:hypothetical protein
MIAEPTIHAGLLAMHRAGQRPENPFRSQIFPLLLGDVRAFGEVVAAAEMPVARPGQDRAANVAVFPQVDPGGGDFVRGRLVQNVRLLWVVQRDICDAIAFFVFDGHGGFPSIIAPAAPDPAS